MIKKIISIFLLILLIFTLVPAAIFADTGADTDNPEDDPNDSGRCVVKSAMEIKDWEKIKDKVAPLTGDLRTDILTIARVQLGYEAYTKDKIVTEDGREKYYTIYGQFFGDRWKYCDWCAAFVSFCAYYANAPKDFPLDISTLRMESKCKKLGYWREWSQYIPKPGDIVLVATSANPHSVCHAAIVEQVFAKTATREGYIVTIEGNTRIKTGAIGVGRFTRRFDDVIGYCVYEKEPMDSEEHVNLSTWRDDKLAREYKNMYYYAPEPKKEVLEYFGFTNTNWYKFWFAPELLPAELKATPEPTNAFKVGETVDVIEAIKPTPAPTHKPTPTPEPTQEPTNFKEPIVAQTEEPKLPKIQELESISTPISEEPKIVLPAQNTN